MGKKANPLYLILTLGFLSCDCMSALIDIKSVITDPVVSRRCKTLLRERKHKIRVRQRLNAMILRNRKLQKSLKEHQKVAKQKLKLNQTQLKNNLRLTAIRVESMEENIVRKGCPGITL